MISKHHAVLRTIAFVLFSLGIPAVARAQSGTGGASEGANTPLAAPTVAPNATVTADAGVDGFGVRSHDGAFRLRLQGLAHYDGRAFLSDDADSFTDGFDLRRVRADVRGTVHSLYDFRLNLDYAGNRVDVLEAYLEGRFSPAVQIRVGKFKAPVGLERLQSASALTFAERAFPTALVPNRDVGVQMQGSLGGARVSYAAGLFNGVSDGASGDSDSSDSKDLAGRLIVQPFVRGPEPLRGLAIGIAGTAGEQRGTATSPGLPSFRTAIGRGTFLRFRGDGTEPGSAVLDGRRTRLAPQGSWYWGPVGLLAEYVRSTSEVRVADETGRLRTTAWQVSGSWVLTGEPASYRGVTPSRPFEPGSSASGAIELAGRVHGLEVERSAFPRFASPSGLAAGATAYTLGLNWYLNRFVRLQTNWERTQFDAADPSAVLRDENVLITRVQLAF